MQRKSGKQKLTKMILALLMSVFVLMENTPVVLAEGNSCYAEYLAKKAAGVEIYEIVREDGVFMGYFEPYSETNPAPTQARTSSNIDWELPANTHTCGVNTYYLTEDTRINVSITQSPSGAGYAGYLGLKDADTGYFSFYDGTISTNGWNGTLVVAYDGNFSFAIMNASNYSIRYTGSYSF